MVIEITQVIQRSMVDWCFINISIMEPNIVFMYDSTSKMLITKVNDTSQVISKIVIAYSDQKCLIDNASTVCSIKNKQRWRHEKVIYSEHTCTTSVAVIRSFSNKRVDETLQLLIVPIYSF